ncbi:MAG: DUF998 domain-containing protein [Rhodospirillaceae bacterium]|jgi:putative copper export protein|nr:DUF998 domain-containing protein [Rhodospirillaceae bacterium]MBT3492032.1 DUF998 domain-containing protein [Rhodospirillaceae bacterium]MBT3781390.1 DUF998 domain-containing protein [Rhodospirillaceae bacterium]MBT3974980.1 DUF998 domain-containing protein [Rhodospirillaceae bacterium]MBT4169333.1 DUF998 domain-containing protein [Rhodospirillaceae bacterium]
MQQSVNDANTLVAGYMALRRAVGMLGLTLPFVLGFGAWLIFQTGLQETVSHYYYTGMRNIFVGVLCAIGVFLMNYTGYKQVGDRPGDPRGVFHLSGAFAIGVALFPTSPNDPTTLEQIVGIMHLTFAAAFFGTLAYVSLVLFTRTDPAQTLTARRRKRIQIYRICGWTILTAIALIVLLGILPDGLVQGLLGIDNPVFYLESVVVMAFGFSWLTKGRMILLDLE